MISIHLVGYNELSVEEKDYVPDNGVGKEDANYVLVTHGFNKDKTIFLFSDAIEPEDATLTRDYRELVDFIGEAYRLGVEDGKLLRG